MTTTTGPRCTRGDCTRPASRRAMCNACYQTFRTRQTAYGRWESLRVDAGPAREHVTRLLESGLGARRIAELAGTRRANIQALINGRPDRGSGRPKRIARDIAARIVAIPTPTAVHEVAAAGQRVPAVGTARRLRALVAIGWPQSALCHRLGITPSNSTRLFHSGGGWVTARTARDAAALFDELQLTPGPSAAARRRAQHLGWVPPLAWDEDSIDDPHAVPDVGASERVSFADRWAELQELGLDWRDSMARIGMKPAALSKMLERHGIPVPEGLHAENWRQRQNRRASSRGPGCADTH